MKKRLLAVVLAVVTAISLTGCGSKTDLSSTSRNADDGTDGNVYIDEDAVALAGSVENAQMTDAERTRAQELKQMAEDALALINEERAAGGLEALEWSTDLENCSMVRAQECASKFSHTRPNGSDWWTVNSNLMWGENLAKGYKTASDLVEAWMNSTGHRANIMDGTFTTAAIAVYETSKDHLYIALEFGI